jgi:hypothetical protein
MTELEFIASITVAKELQQLLNIAFTVEPSSTANTVAMQADIKVAIGFDYSSK